jgi:hypothetical protein
MLVEFDVFSGRPNPRWELDERSAQELRRLQSRLTVSPLAPPEPPALGYRGFSYADETGSCRAFQGYVRTSRGVLADSSFSIERFLLDRLPVEFAPLRRRYASDLGRPD